MGSIETRVAWIRAIRGRMPGLMSRQAYLVSSPPSLPGEGGRFGVGNGVSHCDAFNGDADGICSLLQLRLDAPRESTLVTGVKRDIALLERIPAKRGDTVTALDISVDTNRAALLSLLDR